MKFNLKSIPHRRYNPLKDEWILVSPQRTLRPWQGKVETLPEGKKQGYDPKCYMCPGNKRAEGEKNPMYQSTFVFNNDYPALIPSIHSNISQNSGIFSSESVLGECRVVCFSPKHNLTLAQMSKNQIEEVIFTWISELKSLSKSYNWVQIFENKGELMGCSNPHPHGQIWTSNFIPNEIGKEDKQQKKYFEKNKSVLLLDYLKEENKEKERIVFENDSWIILVPFWAIWPFETLLLPKMLKPRLDSITGKEKTELAELMKKILTVYDKLFNTSMPYSMGWHFAPFNNNGKNYWQLHAHYYPPLLRSATVKKFMVGYEMLAEAQRDITPEQTAKNLRNCL